MLPAKTSGHYDGMYTIDFYDKPWHKFVIRERDEKILSVTACTGIVNKPALIYWAVGLMRDFLYELADAGKDITRKIVEQGSQLHRQVKKEAGDTGSLIHDWIHAYISGQKPDLPTEEKALNGVTAFLRWVNENKIKFIASEKIVYSRKYNYAGILDAIVRINGEKKDRVVDYKTGNSIYNEARYQVAAYQYAVEEETLKKFGNKIILRFSKDTGEFHKLECEDQDKDFEAFLGCLAVKRREDELKKEGM